MKFVFCVEGMSDEAVLRSFVQRILGEPIELHEQPWLVSGYEAAIKLASKFAREAWGRGLDGAVFAVDNDGKPRHHEHDRASASRQCRHCELVRAADVGPVHAQPRDGLGRLVFAFTAPVESLEGWLLLARSGDLTGTFANVGKAPKARRQVKKMLYGSETPGLDAMLRVAVPIADGADLAKLRELSPSFDLFARDLLDAHAAAAASVQP